MLKLMKYEFRKSAFSKLIILALAVLLELGFLLGVLIDNKDFMGGSLGFLLMLAMAGTFYVAFESITVLNKDLKTKNSYMLFLTPHTSYSIVGAKVLSSGVQIVLTGLCFLAVFIVNGAILVAKFSNFAMLRDAIIVFFKEVMSLDIQISNVVFLFLLMLLSWVFFTTLSFLSITISTTVLANSKLKGILSFVIFIVIAVVYGKISDMFQLLIGNNGLMELSLNTQLGFGSLMILVFIVINYLGTAFLLEKKVSV